MGPEEQLGLLLSESAPHRKTETCTRSYQYSFITETCFCASRPTPSMSSETVVTRITEIVIERLRRNPRAISLSMNWKRTALVPLARSAGVAVDAAVLVADQAAVLHLHDPLAHLVDDLVVVSGHDDGRAGAVDPVEQPHDADAGRRVEVAGRLVRQQDRGPVDEGPGDRDPLLLAAGELVREAALLAGEADEVEHLRHGVRDRVPGLADHLQRERHVLEHGLVRQQPEVLEHHTDLTAQLRDLPVRQPPDVLARHVHDAAARPLLAQHQAQESGLARSGRTDEEDELPLDDLEAHVVDRRSRGLRVDLGDVLEPDHTRYVLGRSVGAAGAAPRRRRPRPSPGPSGPRPPESLSSPPGCRGHRHAPRPKTRCTGPPRGRAWQGPRRAPVGSGDPVGALRPQPGGVGEEVARWRRSPVPPRASSTEPRGRPPPSLRPRGSSVAFC